MCRDDRIPCALIRAACPYAFKLSCVLSVFYLEGPPDFYCQYAFATEEQQFLGGGAVT